MSKQDKLREAALEYHKNPSPGKISMKPTTQLETQRDLALAYSPGVAVLCCVLIFVPLCIIWCEGSSCWPDGLHVFAHRIGFYCA